MTSGAQTSNDGVATPPATAKHAPLRRRISMPRDNPIVFVSEGESQVMVDLLNPLEFQVVKFLQYSEKFADEVDNQYILDILEAAEGADKKLEDDVQMPVLKEYSEHGQYRHLWLYRETLLVACVAGIFAALVPCQGTTWNEICGEDPNSMDYLFWSGLIGTVGSIVELTIMYFEAAWRIGTFAKYMDVRLQLTDEWKDAHGPMNSRAKYITASLAHQAMELPPPIDPILGVRPLVETSALIAKLQYYSYGMGRGVVVFFARVLLKRVATRAAIRGASAANNIGYVAVPIIAIWNMAMMHAVVGGAIAMMTGSLAVSTVAPELFATMKGSKVVSVDPGATAVPVREMRVPLTRAVGNVIVADKQFFPSLLVLMGYCRRNLLEVDRKWLSEKYGVETDQKDKEELRRSFISKMMASDVAVQVNKEHKALTPLNLDSRWLMLTNDLGFKDKDALSTDEPLNPEQKDDILATLTLAMLCGTHPNYRQRRLFRTAMQSAGRTEAQARHALNNLRKMQRRMWAEQKLLVQDLYDVIATPKTLPKQNWLSNKLDDFVEDYLCGALWCGSGLNKLGNPPKTGYGSDFVRIWDNDKDPEVVVVGRVVEQSYDRAKSPERPEQNDGSATDRPKQKKAPKPPKETGSPKSAKAVLKKKPPKIAASSQGGSKNSSRGKKYSPSADDVTL